MYNGERRLSLFLYHSFSTHAQGNLLRRFICSRPDLGYKITKDIWATKIPGEISIQKELAGLDDSNRLEHWYPLVYQWYVWYVVNHWKLPTLTQDHRKAWNQNWLGQKFYLLFINYNLLVYCQQYTDKSLQVEIITKYDAWYHENLIESLFIWIRK